MFGEFSKIDVQWPDMTSQHKMSKTNIACYYTMNIGSVNAGITVLHPADWQSSIQISVYYFVKVNLHH